MAQHQTASKIIAMCQQVWYANQADCNAFAKAVAYPFGVTLLGNADSIVNQIASDAWRPLVDGRSAANAAAQGALVVGGLTSYELGGQHGHVVIVIDGDLEHGKYPRAYWGSLNPAIRANGGRCMGINWSFTATHRDQVRYGAFDFA